MVRTQRTISICISLVVLLCHPLVECSSAANSADGLTAVLQYIHSDWDVLTRSMTRCDSIVDPKLPEAALLYLPADFAEPDSVKQLEKACRVRVEHLPMVIEHPGESGVEAISPQGLLFLPNSYVVPGRPFQRNVWMGQLLHYSRAGARQANRSGARNSREFFL